MEKEKLKNTDNGDFILKRKEYLGASQSLCKPPN